MKKYFVAFSLLMAPSLFASNPSLDEMQSLHPSTPSFFKRIANGIINATAHQYFITSTVGYGACLKYEEQYLQTLYSKEEGFEMCRTKKEFWSQDHKNRHYLNANLHPDLTPDHALALKDELKDFKNPFHSMDTFNYEFNFLKKIEENRVIILAPFAWDTFFFDGNSQTHGTCHVTPYALFFEGKQFSTQLFLKELMAENPDKSLHIFSLYDIDEYFAPPATNLIDRFLEYVDGPAGHSAFAKVVIDPLKSHMDVNFVDSMIPSLASSNSCPYFEELTLGLGLQSLHFEYLARGDQTLNFQDCGRFAAIYFDEAFKGRNLNTLTSLDIYKGFKKLEANGYETLHQVATPEEKERGEKKDTPSWFAKAMGVRRTLAEYALSWMVPNLTQGN